tara:strand:+ start:296 stop:721 length:426 start_codon:yes stop_codon:yes gene_type:complete
MSKRSNSRKLAMRMLYQFSIRSEHTIASIAESMETNAFAEDTVSWAITLSETVVNHLDMIDSVIESLAIEWNLERIHLIDKALLRLGIAEIKFIETPFQVVMNEIIELSKEYSTDDSPKFINGILGKFIENELKETECLPD